MAAILVSSLVFLFAIIVRIDANIDCDETYRLCKAEFQPFITNPDSDDNTIGCRLATGMRLCMGDCMDRIIVSDAVERTILNSLNHLCDNYVLTQDGQFSGQLQCFSTDDDNCFRATLVNIEYVVRMTLDIVTPNLPHYVCPLLDKVFDCVSGQDDEYCLENVMPFSNTIFTFILGDMFSVGMPDCQEDNLLAYRRKRSVN